MDHELGRSRGTGFVCFWNKEDADKAIEQSEILRQETTGTAAPAVRLITSTSINAADNQLCSPRKTRPTQAPIIEVLAISPATTSTGIRDVFSGRQSMGDDSDWVDEDDDMTGYAGGLGQMPSSSSSTYPQPLDSPIMSPLPRSRAAQASSSKRAGGSLTVNTSNRNGRGKGSGRSPMGRSSPLPPEAPFDQPTDPRGGRRGQLPNSRSGPAFRQPIQEEDEDEE